MAKNKEDAELELTDDFLYELFYNSFKSKQIMGIVAAHMQPEFLPDDQFIDLFKAMRTHHNAFKAQPSYGAMTEKFKRDDDILDLINEIRETKFTGSVEALIATLEEFLKDVRISNLYDELGILYSLSVMH